MAKKRNKARVSMSKLEVEEKKLRDRLAAADAAYSKWQWRHRIEIEERRAKLQSKSTAPVVNALSPTPPTRYAGELLDDPEKLVVSTDGWRRIPIQYYRGVFDTKWKLTLREKFCLLMTSHFWVKFRVASHCQLEVKVVLEEPRAVEIKNQEGVPNGT